MNERVIAVIADERNGWMEGFAAASSWIARGIIDGSIPAELVANFPVGSYDDAACQTFAKAARLTWCEDRFSSDGPEVDTEDVEIAIGAIRGLSEVNVGSYDECVNTTWMFYDESIAERGITIDEIRAELRGIDIREAAELIVAADEHTAKKYADARRAAAV